MFSTAAIAVLTIVMITYFISPENYECNFRVKESLILAIIVILLVPIQTTVEEVVFRGYLMQGLGHWLNSIFMALFLTSSVCGLVHLANPELSKLGNSFILIYIIG